MGYASSEVPDAILRSYQRARISWTFYATDGNGDLINLIGYSIDFSLRHGNRESPGGKLLSVTSSNYITPTISGFTLLIPASVTTYDPGDYYAELIITPPASDPIFAGWVLWQHEITKIGQS